MAEQRITIKAEGMRAVNFSMQQNYVPLLRSIRLTNVSDETQYDLKLRVRFDPAFAQEYTVLLDAMEPGSSVEVSPVKILLSTEYLFSVTEKVIGNYTIEVYRELLIPKAAEEESVIPQFETEEEILSSASGEVELLAKDQWSGLGTMPELVSAFVTPNHPKIAETLRSASDQLQKWGRDPAFTAYQTQNTNNVKLQMAAIYAAIQAQQIDYVVHPATFEPAGQRIRLPHTVLEQKQGNCLDLSILYASCLEAAGLNGLIVFTKGHAFGGCWLEEESFADCTVDDVSALEKRTADGAEEILLVEMTDVVRGKNVPFDTAIQHARAHLARMEEFDFVIDLSRCRNSNIRPIPTRLEDAQQEAVDAAGADSFAAAPSVLRQNLKGRVIEGTVEIGRKELWERKLLDFSLRNSLLNFRVTRSAVQLLVADPAELEDALADGKDFTLQALPPELKTDLRDDKMFSMENDKALVESISAKEFSQKRLRTCLSETELQNSLKGLQRAAKVSLEENGANTLFVAAGFLRWYETELSEKARYAPLVMIPVELVRSIKNSGYIVRSRNEETQINVTLLEYLRQDHGVAIGGLDPLPEDEHGIDLPLVFQTIRQAVMDKKRWNVENFCFLGLFSFGQFVMWNDLRNRTEDLKSSKVVQSLLEGRMTWEADDLGIDAGNIDEKFAPSDLAVPLSADSSQMVAIATAAKGQSFVLHGPPGTGKSQTITNMIANALYQGKSVLFVAEKMAALSVVQRRLAAIGLDPFCLELHSNKANKAAVLKQLEKTLEVGHIKEPEEYARTAEQLHSLRRELNHVIAAIHEKKNFGGSLYDAIAVYEQNKALKGKVDLADSREMPFTVESVSAELLAEWQELLGEYATASSVAGDLQSHPLKGVCKTEYSMELRDNAQRVWKETADSCEAAQKDADLLRSQVGTDLVGSRDGLAMLCRMGRLMLEQEPMLGALVSSPNYDTIMERVRLLIQNGRNYLMQMDRISQTFRPQIFTGYNAGDALVRLQAAQQKWFLPKMTGTSAIVKEVKAYALNPAAVTKDNIKVILEELWAAETLKAELNDVPQEITSLLGGLYMAERTDFAALEQALQKADKARQLRTALPQKEWEAYTAKCAGPVDPVELPRRIENIERFLEKEAGVRQADTIDFSDIEMAPDYLQQAEKRYRTYSEHTGLLRDWTGYQRVKQALDSMGLDCVTKAVEGGRVSAKDAKAAFLCSLHYRFASELISSDSRLSEFRGAQFEGMIDRYRDTLEVFRALTVQELVAKLSSEVPAGGGEAAASSELGILKKAIKSNGRMMSIRKLFDQIPALLRRLCPCMLMSPISVAQYIDPKFPKFDLVVFDEASQLPTSEAVGTIARGENVIVVGDPKQLPPTSFFKSNRIDEEHAEHEDLESLLDDCLAITLPQEYLKWHYRSRHESLIAYSNMQYYDNKLYTFPSPNDLVSQVKLVQLDGVYDMGKTKQNRAEAEAVVAEIVRRLSDPVLRNDSIGVVTFSVVQQHLIEDLLTEAFTAHPKLEEWDRQSAEPVFIKNLENVQGDERDVILFSICYGPDKNGKVSMNFGPLNRDGGWRRLNVAISRARKEMIVYSVLRPEQIDISRTRAEGVAGLKGFLEFAKHGQGMIVAKSGTGTVHEDAVVREIAAEVSRLGYEVRTNVGCSKYRLDMGIVDPENKEDYLLGILLDGENMSGDQTAADRFAVQPSVLKGLGWRTMRIWTIEWLDDAQKVLQEIGRRIEEAKLQKEEEKCLAEQRAAEAKEAAAREAEEENIPAETKDPEAGPAEEEDPGAEETADTIQLGNYTFERMESAGVSKRQEMYESAAPEKAGTAEAYADHSQLTKVRKTVVRYLIAEAPISRRALMKKTFADWGVSRTTARMEDIFDQAVQGISGIKTKEGERVFYWRADQDPDTYDKYRGADQNGVFRSIEDVPSQEIRAAIRDILEAQVSLSREDLVKTTAKCFGCPRMGSTIEVVIRYALDEGIRRGIFSETDGGKIILA